MASAMAGLQEATEVYLISLDEDDNFCCINARRVTIMLKDNQLAKQISGA